MLVFPGLSAEFKWKGRIRGNFLRVSFISLKPVFLRLKNFKTFSAAKETKQDSDDFGDFQDNTEDFGDFEEFQSVPVAPPPKVLFRILTLAEEHFGT